MAMVHIIVFSHSKTFFQAKEGRSELFKEIILLTLLMQKGQN